MTITHTMKALALSCLTFALMLPASASADRHPERLLNLLSGIDVVPTAAQLTEAAPSPEAALFQVAMDREAGLYLRKRAASLLSSFPNDQAEAWLTTIAWATENQKVRWMAIYTVIRTFGKMSPKRQLDFAAAHLSSVEPMDREAAVRGLRWVPGPGADTLLERAAKKETVKMVQAAIRRVQTVRARR